MEVKDKVLATMKEAGQPLNAGKIAELSGLDRKEVDKAMKQLKEEGAIIVNTPKSADEIRPLLNGYTGRVVTIDARKISEEALGKYFPNSPMLAAVVATTKVMDRDTFMGEMRASYLHKFAKKPEVIDGNMKALEMTFDAVEEA